MTKINLFIVMGFLAAMVYAPPAYSDSFGFEGVTHGTILNTQFSGVTISAVNLGGGPDLAVAFDTTQISTSDPDLEDPWAAGNLASTTALGNILIIQENSTGIGDGVADDPDDEGSRPSGQLILAFHSSYSSFGFDLVDVEDTVATPVGERGFLEFYSGAALVKTVQFMDFSAGGLLDNGAIYGNRSANRITAFSVGTFDRVVVNLGGSGGIDNIQVPEPTTLLLLSMGLTGLALSRKRPRK